jgi:hypothetical protein
MMRLGLATLVLLSAFLLSSEAGDHQARAATFNSLSPIWLSEEMFTVVQLAEREWRSTVARDASQGLVVAPPDPAPPALDKIDEHGAVVGFLYTSQSLQPRGTYTLPPGTYAVVLRRDNGVWAVEFVNDQSVLSVPSFTLTPLSSPVPAPAAQVVNGQPCYTWGSTRLCP